MTDKDKEYIGDGVYVSTAWGNLTLETERDGVRHWIVLEPQVFAALVDYVVARRAKVGGDTDDAS